MTTQYVLTGPDGVSRFYAYFADLLADVQHLGFTEYEIDYETVEPEMKTVTNLMSGIEIEIPVDTRRCCDPSTELYWSM